MHKYTFHIINVIMILILSYCYLLDPLNKGTNEWSISALAFACIFFFMEYVLYKKTKKAKSYALWTTTFLFIIVYLLININHDL